MTARPIKFSRWRDYVRAGRSKIETTITVLDRLSRQRALTLQESLQLERAIKAEGYSRRTWLAWKPEEDDRARKLRAQGQTYGEIACTLQRTPDAVASRLRALRLMDGSENETRRSENGPRSVVGEAGAGTHSRSI